MSSEPTSFESPLTLPEIACPTSMIRISPELDVPLTNRVRSLIDTPSFRRLSRISQLGLVSLVYPGATHSRMEHSLGVYRNALLYLQRLAYNQDFIAQYDHYQAQVFLVAALLHDIGHWPFCHVLEDASQFNLPRHENLARNLICDSEIATILKQQWKIEPSDVADFLIPKEDRSAINASANTDIRTRIFRSMLSGSVDIDKLDYLERDSLHAGVPYGRNFDRARLISSLCIDTERGEIAITEKGRTAAEMMVFARYVMFSEVYWHHVVRSASAMLQRAVHAMRDRTDLIQSWTTMDESTMMNSMLEHTKGKRYQNCVHGLFGPTRVLYKRIAQFDFLCQPDLHRALSRRPYEQIIAITDRLASIFAGITGMEIDSFDVLIDAPPLKLDVQYDLQVIQSNGVHRSLGELSPVVQSLATRQFDDIVKRVRIFVRPDLRDKLRSVDIADCVHRAIDML